VIIFTDQLYTEKCYIPSRHCSFFGSASPRRN